MKESAAMSTVHGRTPGQALHATERGGAPLPVLIVDDDLDFLSFVSRMLTKAGWEFDIAETGRRALALASHRRYRAVLLDLLLPDIDGLEVLAQLRRLSVPPDVVLVFGAATISSVFEAGRLGAQDFLVKPVTIDDICDALGPAEAAAPQDHFHGEPVRIVANMIAAVYRAEHDVRTVAQWGRLVGMSGSAIFSHCARIGLRAKPTLDLGRLMRVTRVATRHAGLALVLDSVDPRTVGSLLSRAGLRRSELDGLSLGKLLRVQRLLEHAVLVKRILDVCSDEV